MLDSLYFSANMISTFNIVYCQCSRAVTFGIMAPSSIDRLQLSQNQRMRCILGVPRDTSAKMMRHELQMVPVEHRANPNRAKLYRKIRGNTKHPLPATINRRQQNGWTTEIHECHRLASRQLEAPTQLQRHDTAHGNNYHTNVG